MAMGDKYDPKYRMRHRAPSVRRLLHYKMLPPPLVGNPPHKFYDDNWDAYCRIVYESMMEEKRGIVPRSKRRGLWFYAEEIRAA